MPTTKIRHEFLADADVTARLNELVQNSGVTKTQIIIQALKAFTERGIETEFSQRTTKRFDILSHELGTIRHDLATVQNDLEAARRSRESIQSDVTLTVESQLAFFRWCMEMTAHFPPPDTEKQDVAAKRWKSFADFVNRKIAALKKTSPDEKNGKENP